MAQSNKATVKINGQEYTIAGNSSSDQIVMVANHVDSLMKELASGLPSLPNASLAVLAAVNIANDYFEASSRIKELESVIADLKKDANHYIKMWEDAKASFKKYQEDAQNSIEQLQELQRIYNMKSAELNKANDAIKKLNERCAALQGDLASAKEELANSKEKTMAEAADADELMKKYKELENSFFDIQMENLQLKNEMDKLKKNETDYE